VLSVLCTFNLRILVWFEFVIVSECVVLFSVCCMVVSSALLVLLASSYHLLPRGILHVEQFSELMSRQFVARYLFE
jgi:hypothetical protein